MKLGTADGKRRVFMDDLWHTLDADNSGSVSVDEFASKFGLFGGAEMVMERRRLEHVSIG